MLKPNDGLTSKTYFLRSLRMISTIKSKDLSVFLGRQSPFHKGHAEVLLRACHTSKAVLVLIGSAGQARTTKNPFTFAERERMIRDYLESCKIDCKLQIKPLYDHPYNDQAWIRGVQDAVDICKNDLRDVIGINPSVYLTGADRDKSTWYLKTFGDFFISDLVDPHGMTLSATKVRELLFGSSSPLYTDISTLVPSTTFRFLLDFVKTPEFAALSKEYSYIEKYKKDWSGAPYAPTFVTVDACVIQSGHVLLNTRANFPGIGLWALPGGFLEQDEKLVDGCVRELIEETKIELSKAQLYGSIKSREIFDHPDRSLRGRTITTAFLFKLDDSKPLPKVKPQKGEVLKVAWVPINDALKHSELFFEDHYSILTTLLGRISN
jgi:bifunctional NMN adenylyltransferase/nudix hydrolase